MKSTHTLIALNLSLLVSMVGCQSSPTVAATPAAATQAPNTLSAAETKAGWVLLFDGNDPGKSLRGYKRSDMPKEWVAEDGALVLRGKGGDIVTKSEYADFEYQVDWKIAPGGNSGIMWHVSEEFNYPWETGPEMQVLDDTLHADGKSQLTSAGACYALYAAPRGVVKPVGEWNTANLRVVGTKVTCTLNGVKTADFDMSSQDWKDRLAASKFASMKSFATKSKGYIALQDHGDVVMYRNMKVCPISSK